jgi:ketosteroid isomerase-like protein
MMAHPNEELMRKATDALNAGDMETFLGFHAADVVVHVTGRNPFAGEFSGHQGVTESFQQQLAILDGPPEFKIHDVLASDDHGVILGIGTFSRGGKTLESQQTVVMHIEDGLAKEIWVTSNDPYAEDEFFG